MKQNRIFQRTLAFFEKLSSKPRIDGMEITATAVKYAFFEGEEVKTAAVKLPPGTIVAGKVADRGQLIAGLERLKGLVMPPRKGGVFRVNVVLPTSLVFTQSFLVPNVGPQELEESVNLNLQMISPIPKEEANMSAQIVSEHDFNYEFLGAFASKKEIDSYQSALSETGFAPVSFEFQALSLARFMRKTSVVAKDLVLVFELSGEGIDLFLVKEGNIYFSYFRSWQSIQGNAPAISKEVLESVVIEEIRKVLNFSSGKFGISPASVMFLAPGFEQEIAAIVANVFNMKSAPIVSAQMKISPVFYATAGAAMRWRDDRENTNFKAINLGGEDLSRAIYEEQVLNFLSLWRGIIAGALAVLLAAYAGGAIFVINQYNAVNADVKAFKPPLDEAKLADLINKANSFNATVAELASIRGSNQDYYSPLRHVLDLSIQNQVKITSINVTSLTSPISLTASAPSYDVVLAFKNALAADRMFSNVDVPLTQIITQSNNSVTFSVSFSFNL